MSKTVYIASKHKNHKTKPNAHKRKGIVLMIAFSVLLLLSVCIFVLPAFRIKEVIVEGNRIVQTQDILMTCQLSEGDHILSKIDGGVVQVFTLRYGSLENEIYEKFPYVRSVTVTAQIPSVVRITVEERMKIGYLDVPDGYAVIDKEGYVVELSGQDPPKGVPLIQGIPIQTAVLGHPITLSDTRGFDRSLAIFGSVLDADFANSDGTDYSLMDCVHSLRYVGENTNYMVLSPQGSAKTIMVKIGSIKEISEDMIWLRHALATDTIDYSQSGVLDMSGEEYTMRTNT
ncbi:MAG: FtsQ-type POTRA domain-containing protein [Clostridiales bacterium]|nr:FtsQ-type POTRA domain-containing protein [Clostridiales bacterium]